MNQQLQIFAEITPKTAHFDHAQNAIHNILKRTRDEDGCIQFDLFTDELKQILFLYERWENQAAFDYHHTQPYTKAVFKSYQDWLAKPPRIINLRMVE